MVRIVSCLFIAMAVFACKSDKSKITSIRQQPLRTETGPEPQSESTWFTKAMQQAKVDCKVAGGCPEYIGMVGFYEEDFGEDTAIVQCTGWLYKKNIVATNSHCITQMLREDKSKCPQALAIYFPATATQPAVVRTCKELIMFSDFEEEWDSDDYAFFRIDDAQRPAAELSRRGLPDGLNVTAIKIDPLPKGVLGGTIVSDTCPTVQNSILNTLYINDHSRTALAFGCPSIRGNSGSPVVNDAGEVVGLLQSRKMEAYLRFLWEKFSKDRVIVAPNEPPPHFVFSNLTCIPDPETKSVSEPAQSLCFQYRYKTLVSKIKESQVLLEPFVEAHAKIRQEWIQTLPSIFEYNFEDEVDSSPLYMATPKCVKPLQQWPQNLLALEKSENGQRVFEVLIDYVLHIQNEYRTDSLLRFIPKKFFSEKKRARRHRLEVNGASVKLKVQDAALEGEDQPVPFDFPVQWCQ